jgi:CheY-like chemotaxis protein
MPQILVIEDESIVALDIQSRLQNLGYQVPVTVGRGELAIEKVETQQPDLVLMDIMPQGDLDGVLRDYGYEVLEARKGEEALVISELHQGIIHPFGSDTPPLAALMGDTNSLPRGLPRGSEFTCSSPTWSCPK